MRNNPAILVSGHDLVDLEQLLEQTRGTGVDVYTHGEMLPAHAYPAFKKYDNFVGNYGNSWWKQLTEFESFHGPILFTTNCIVPPKSEEIRARIFTTGAAGFPGCTHIKPDKNGKKDFSAIIALAKTLPAPEEIEHGEIVNGFAHAQVLALADKVIDAVKSGAIKKFFVMAGCDGRMKSREYYTEFAEKLPEGYRHSNRGLRKVPLQQTQSRRYRRHSARAGRGAVQRQLFARGHRAETRGGVCAHLRQRAARWRSTSPGTSKRRSSCCWRSSRWA